MRLAVLFSIALATGLHAAEFEVLLGGVNDERGVFVSETADGGYIVVGEVESSRGDEDVLLARFDRTGKEVWTKAHGGTDTDYGWSVFEFDAGFVVAGSTKSNGSGGYDCYLLATDESGEEKWSRTFGGENDERCWAMQRLPDGGWIVVGETSRAGRGTEDCYLLAVDSKGRERWSRSFGGDKSDRCFAIALADDGLVLAGQTFSEGAGDRDAWVIGTDRDGNMIWSDTWGGKASDVAHAVVRTGDGNFLVTGYTTSLATTGDDPFLIKIDSSGKEIWTRVLPVNGVAHTITGDETVDGDLCLTGFVQSDRGVAALLIRADSSGKVKTIRKIRQTTGDSSGYAVRGTSDGGCVLTGHTTEGAAGGRDLLLVKVESSP